MARYLNPRPGMRRIQKHRALHSGGMVLVVCGLAFCVAFGRAAAVSFSLSAVLRPVLVSSPNEAAASFIPIVGSRLVLVLPFRVFLDFDRAWWFCFPFPVPRIGRSARK